MRFVLILGATDRQTDRQADRQTDIQTDRHTTRYTDRHGLTTFISVIFLSELNVLLTVLIHSRCCYIAD